MTTSRLPGFPDIERARQRLQAHAHRTPVVTSRTLDAMVGAQVFLKCENLQRMGAFKFRGAFNALSALSVEARAKGVVAYSSGNHAQAVALSARLLDMSATIVMPSNAPRAKLDATEGYGARVVRYHPGEDSREQLAQQIVRETGATLIPPFDHPDVIAGQGTVAAELIEDAGPLDALLVCCGGGGLLSGCAIAASVMAPGCKVIGVEPELGDDVVRSFAAKTPQRLSAVPATISDGTRTLGPGELTFPLIMQYVHGMITVSDEDLIHAVRFALLRLKLVIEPSGALGLAAMMSGKAGVTGRVGVVVSGGNVDAEMLRWILMEDGARPSTPPEP